MGPELFELAHRHGLATPSEPPTPDERYVPRKGTLAAEYVKALAAIRHAERRARQWRALALLFALAIGVAAGVEWMTR